MSIKNIVFDIGNVLVDFRWYDYMLDLGFTEEEASFLGENMVLNPLWGEFDRGARTDRSVIDEFKQRMPEYAALIEEFHRDPTDIVAFREGADKWVKSYRERGFRIYLLSNYPERLFSLNSKHFKFTQHIDGALISYQIKHIKPEPEIFSALFERFSLVPEECIFIDDSEKNIEGAKKAGMHGVVYTSREQAIEDVEKIINSQNR